MAEKAVHMIVHGRVQGVGFRFFAREQAASRGLKGWTKNCSDGSVEIVAEGGEGILGEYILKIEKGPTFGNVANLDVDWIEPTGTYSDFSILF